MNSNEQEETAELSESLRIAAEGDQRLANVLSKFTKLAYVPSQVSETNDNPPMIADEGAKP